MHNKIYNKKKSCIKTTRKMTYQTVNQINSYLTFKLDEEFFSANVSKVLEILELVKITRVPKAPDFMRGVINLRGEVLPVIDTRIKFGLPGTEETSETCIVVVEIEMEGENLKTGILVDSVEEVLEIEPKEILPPPSIGNQYKSAFINGMIKSDDQFLMILDVDKILTTKEIDILKDKV